MNCEQSSKLIISELQGCLDRNTSRELHAHIEECPVCRKEYNQIKWLFEGMRENEELIGMGHISSALLYEFAQEPGNLRDETNLFVKEHLDKCKDCRDDLNRIKKLLPVELSNFDVSDKKKWFRKNIFSYLLNRKLVPVYAAIVIVVLGIFLYREIVSTPSFIVRPVSEESAFKSDCEIRDLAVSRIARGEKEESEAKATFSTSASGNVIIRIKVNVFKREKALYRAVIHSEGGEFIWGSAVGMDYLKEGNLLLMVDRKSFEPGLYYIEIIELSPEGNELTIGKASMRFTK